MEWDLLLMISLMFAVAIYLVLGKLLSNVVLGMMVFSNAINLLLVLTSENPNSKAVAILDPSVNTSYIDPLPQALALTAIVIGFGLLSFFLIIIYQVFRQSGSESQEKLFGRKD